MAKEIERKFLLVNDDWRDEVDSSCHYAQGYLSNSDKVSIRIRTSGENAYLNFKSATLGITRTEYEYEVPLADADEMLANFCDGPLIKKVRYFVKRGNHTWEIDVFEGDNAGLVVAEIELQAEDEPFTRPDWIGVEVSDDSRYYNVCLVTHPYCEWTD